MATIRLDIKGRLKRAYENTKIAIDHGTKVRASRYKRA